MESFLSKSSGLLVVGWISHSQAYVLKARHQKLGSEEDAYYTYAIQIIRQDQTKNWVLHKSGEKFIQLHHLLECYFEDLPPLPELPKFKIEGSKKSGGGLFSFLFRKKRKDSDESFRAMSTIDHLPEERKQRKQSLDLGSEASTNMTQAQVKVGGPLEQSMRELEEYINSLLSRRLLLNFQNLVEFFHLRAHAADILNTPPHLLLSVELNYAPNPPNEVAFCSFYKDKNIVILGLNALPQHRTLSYVELRSLEMHDPSSQLSPLWGVEYKDRRISAMKWSEKERLLIVGFTNGGVICGQLNKSAKNNQDCSVHIFYEFEDYSDPVADFAISEKMLLLFHFAHQTQILHISDLNNASFLLCFPIICNKPPHPDLAPSPLSGVLVDDERSALFVSNQSGLIFVYSIEEYTPTYRLTFYIDPTTSIFPVRLNGLIMTITQQGKLIVPSQDGVLYFCDPYAQGARFQQPMRSLNVHEALGLTASFEQLLWSRQKVHEIIVAGDNGIIIFLQNEKGVHALRSSERASKVKYLRLLEGGILASMDREGEFCLWSLPKQWRSKKADEFEAQFQAAIHQLIAEKIKINGA